MSLRFFEDKIEEWGEKMGAEDKFKKLMN